MTLILTSSPCIEGEASLNPVNGFVDQMHELLHPGAKCLFISSDPDNTGDTDAFGDAMAEAFAKIGLPLFMAKLDWRSAEQAESLIADAEFIILSGGHVPTENAFFQEIGLRQLLEGYEGVIMGISAGSMNAADTVYAAPEEEGEAADPDFQKFYEGLGLTDLMILPHYQKVKDNVLDGLLLFEEVIYPDSDDNQFLALVDGSYVVCCDGSQELRGEAYLIEDGELEQITEEGDVLELTDE